ncbi:MAG: hypothetical protein GX418_07160 [Clostridiales bacterium]|nr:hypothetical protein [Clostridiales bacterium]
MIAALLRLWKRYRQAAVWAALGFAAFFGLFYALAPFLMEDLATMARDVGGLYQKTVGEAFLARLLLAALCSLTVCLFLLLGFALRRRARGLLWSAGALGLFLAGGALARCVLLPKALAMLLSILRDRFEPRISLLDYLLFCETLILIVAALFELPLALTLLHRMGLVRAQSLRANRKRVVLGALILLAIVTPSQDMVTLLMATLPFWLLFEGSVFWLGLMEKRHA